MRNQALLLATLVTGCVTSHHDRDPIRAYEPIIVAGYAYDPATPIQVEMFHKLLGSWVVVAQTTSGTLEVNQESLYQYSTTVNITPAALRCYYNAECGPPSPSDMLQMRVRAPQSQVVDLYTFVEDAWACINANFEGSYVSAGAGCVHENQTVVDLVPRECALPSDCSGGQVCAEVQGVDWAEDTEFWEAHLTGTACTTTCRPLAGDCPAGTECDPVRVVAADGTTSSDYACVTPGTIQKNTWNESGNGSNEWCWGDHTACENGACRYQGDPSGGCYYYSGCCSDWCDPAAPDCPSGLYCEPEAIDPSVGTCQPVVE